jgi:uncharacterized membrane protein YcaP (DUF421 family)
MIYRPVVVYLFVVLLLRVFGKRELAQLNPFDLVVLLTLSNTVQNAILGDDTTLWGGCIRAFVLVGTNYLVVRFLFGHRRLDQIFQGRAVTLVKDGRLNKQELAKELLTVPELTVVAHRQGFHNLSEVQSCVLDPGGTFFMEGKTPRPEIANQLAMMKKLEAIEQQLRELRGTA